MGTVTTLTHPLFDGPIIPLSVMTTKAVMTYRMAKILKEADAWHDEHDARLVLRRAGFSYFDIGACREDVVHLIEQHRLAMEMAGS